MVEYAFFTDEYENKKYGLLVIIAISKERKQVAYIHNAHDEC